MASDCTISLPDLLCSWEEDRKLVLRGWSLVFIFLATLLVFSVVDGRMAYVHGPYTGFIGLWIDCRRHKCANVGQFTVYTHMSKGFIFLALALCLILLPTMFLSFRPVCRRLNKIDFIFSFLSIGIAFCPSLAPPQCRAPDSPQPDALCHRLQQAAPEATVRMWSYSTPFMERRLSYFRWASRHHSLHLQQLSISARNLEPAQKLSTASNFVNYLEPPQQRDDATSQDTDESPQPDASTSVPVAQFPSDLP
nr:uncharacterized protein LOC102552731 isoform X5 [Rattus norvegicus]